MATAKREAARTQALNFAQCFSAGKVDWKHFVRTGEMNEYRRGTIPHNPTYQAAVERLERKLRERN